MVEEGLDIYCPRLLAALSREQAGRSGLIIGAAIRAAVLSCSSRECPGVCARVVSGRLRARGGIGMIAPRVGDGRGIAAHGSQFGRVLELLR